MNLCDRVVVSGDAQKVERKGRIIESSACFGTHPSTILRERRAWFRRAGAFRCAGRRTWAEWETDDWRRVNLSLSHWVELMLSSRIFLLTESQGRLGDNLGNAHIAWHRLVVL